MKRGFLIFGVLALLFLAGFRVGANTLEADLSYVLGGGLEGNGQERPPGFLAHAGIKISPQVFVDGFFLSGQEEGFGIEFMGGGAKYRVVAEEGDLDVFLGAGWAQFEEKSGIYGKLSLSFQFDPRINLRSDLSYAPNVKLWEKQESFLYGRATLSYEIYEGLGLQGTVAYFGQDPGEGDSRSGSLLYGGGLLIRF